MLDFRVLGPFEVLEQGMPLSLGAPKQRALLALLVLHHPDTVSGDRLIELLWGKRPPATAAKGIQVYVSRLRRTLAEASLVTLGKSYALRAEPRQIDAHRFEQLLGEGRALSAAGSPYRAAAKLDEALGLWRGPALADLSDQPFVEGECARLEELRLTATEEWIDAQLAAGAAAELVGTLRRLVRDHPLRERFRGQLMLALYRAGRQAEALSAYRDANKALREEVGLQPSPMLQRLERAILHQKPELELPPAPALELPRGRLSAFVGRLRELGELRGGLEDAMTGHGRVMLVSGDPGIGKSRLAEELAVHAADRGAVVLVGRCWEVGGAPPYWPWVQVLRGLVRTRGAESVRELLGEEAPCVAEILPELRARFPDLERPTPLESDRARFLLFDAVTSLLRRAAERRAIVLVLDDVHAADASSLLLLEYLTGELADAHLLVVATYRDVDPTLAGPLRSTLAGLARRRATDWLPLAGLSQSEVARFIELSGGLGDDAAAAAVHDQTSGNPFFVGELVRLLMAEGGVDQPLSGRPRIPQGLRAVIDRRLRRLPDECRRVLSLASVFGRDFRLDALELLSEGDGETMLGALEHSIAERVVTELPATTAHFRFRHAVVREVLYDELPIGRRIALHRRAGEALESVHVRDRGAHLADIAHHYLAAGRSGDPDRAIVLARDAGESALRLLAFEEAVRLFERALELLDSTSASDDDRRCELLLALGDAQSRAGHGAAAQNTFR